MIRPLVWVLWGWALAASAQPLLLRSNPLSTAWLSVPDATRTLLRSGYDFNDANYDSGNLIRVEPAGLSFSNAASHWVLFDAEGPGVITSLWFTGKSRKGQAWIGGRLNFFFDGDSTPAITGRLPEFLEAHQLAPAPLAERSSGGWLAYVPIHFARSLKITVSEHEDGYTHRQNGRGETIPHLYHQISWQRLSQPTRSATAEALKAAATWSRDAQGAMRDRSVELPPGRWTTVFAAQGKGILNALELTFRKADPDQVRLRVTADNRVCVELDVAEFWGFRRSARPQAQFQSLLLTVNPTNATYASYWPMPHREKFAVELENRGNPGSVQVSTRHLDSWPEPDHFYFHAARVADRTEHGRDLKILESMGRGHYVGAILELANKTLEGDDRFYVDGESFPPAWHGTGTEDYFRCGWYFHGGALTRPLYGLLDNGQPKLAYRFHLADRINFTRSVVIGFEHGHRNEYLGPYRGVVFWYAER